MERNPCCKGQSFYRHSDYHRNTSHTQPLQLVWHCRSHDSLEVKKIIKKDRINSSPRVTLKRRIALSITRVIMRVNWQLCYQGGAQCWHQCPFLSSMTMETRYLLNPYLQCYKGTCPTGQESRIRIRIKAHSWLSRREDIDGDTLEVGIYNVFTKTFCYTTFSVLNHVFLRRYVSM